jgi:hypothetical protein
MHVVPNIWHRLTSLALAAITDARAVLFFCTAIIVASSGCSGPSTNVQNPPPPPSNNVSIAFQSSPPTSVSIGGTASITAVVKNDTTNAGIDWTLLCPTITNCGTLSPLHSPSGSPVTYSPPSVIPGNSQTFTIEGFATADHTQNVVTSITVNGYASILKGTYVFATQGEDPNGAFQLAGVVVLDGNGGITSGEQTHSDSLLSVSDAITGGSYFIGPDGRGTLTINTADQNIGQAGIENLSLVVLDNTRALIQTFDNSTLPVLSGEASSGTLELQTSTAAPTAGYAFVVGGVDIATAPVALGGVLNIDSPNAISGKGSVADENDANAGFIPANTISGTLTSPDALGSLKFNLVAAFAPSIQFTGYIVNATHIKLIESDMDGTGAGFGSTAGVAVAQGAATGTFTNNNAFAGTYVFKILGQDPSLLPSSLASLGKFTADASGNLNNGYNDEVLAGISVLSGTPYAVSDSFTGTYALDSVQGTGRVDSTVTYTSNGQGPELIFYLIGNGNPPLLLDADSSSLGSGISVATGIAYTQAASPFSFNGPFGMSFVQSNGSSLENDATGKVAVTGSANNLTGVIDINLSTTPSPATQLSGTFVAPTTGRFTGTLTNSFFTSPNTTISVAYYPVDANNILFIETDFSVSNESTLGYFAARTPLCSLPACQ